MRDVLRKRAGWFRTLLRARRAGFGGVDDSTDSNAGGLPPGGHKGGVAGRHAAAAAVGQACSPVIESMEVRRLLAATILGISGADTANEGSTYTLSLAG